MLGLNNFGAIVCFLIISALAQEKFTLETKGINNEIILKEAATTTEAVHSTKTPILTLKCPKNVRVPIFSLPCENDKDCRVFGPNLACCKDRCIKGILVPVKEKQDQLKERTRSAKIALAAPPAVNTNLVCPNKSLRIPIFSLPCSLDADCRLFGQNLLCCHKRCLKGIEPPNEINNIPRSALFGLVERSCPKEPISEFFNIKECSSDAECVPRICCPESYGKGSKKHYCRTPDHNLDKLPGSKQIEQPLKNIANYMKCTPPPKTDLFPKPCNSTLDCFPNLCCQENGLKYCRPPKKSLIALMADLTSRIGAAEVTRKFIERISK